MTTYSTDAQMNLIYNVNDIIGFADDDGDGSADTGVVAACNLEAADTLYSIVYDRYPDMLAPASYTAGSGLYPVLEGMNAQLGIDILRHRQGGAEAPTTENNGTIKRALLIQIGHYALPELE